MGEDQPVKLSDHIATKFGLGGYALKAAMQEFAYSRVDRNIIRILKVYCYWESKKLDPHRYLCMQYIPGQGLQDVDLEARKDILPESQKLLYTWEKTKVQFLAQLLAVNRLVMYGGGGGGLRRQYCL